MSTGFPLAVRYPAADVVPPPDPQTGAITAGRNVFTDSSGQTWSMRSVTAFLLFFRWLNGEDIAPFVSWAASLGANTVRVLGMVKWPSATFGPGITPGWWEELPDFLDYLSDRGMRIEFTVFASAQDIMPNQDQQRAHLRRVVDLIGGRWNVFIEVANEPWQNGCEPVAIFKPTDARRCPMAYGLYNFIVTQESGQWVARLPVLDYVTIHNPRDADSWSRKGKDNCEYRDGSGDGSQNGPLYAGCHIPPVGDEPMGAAEQTQPGRRSNYPPDFFWYHCNTHINGAGSTFHSDVGLQALVPEPGSAQQACAEAAALAWASIAPQYQSGQYTRGGLTSCPLVFDGAYFPEATSRIYGRILGDQAIAVAIKPNQGWVPQAAAGWRIVSTVGPQDSLVLLTRG